MEIDWTHFLGWCAIINSVFLIGSAIVLIIGKDFISKMHSKLFGVKQDNLTLLYITFLGNYKIAIIILNVVPYLALKIMQ